MRENVSDILKKYGNPLSPGYHSFSGVDIIASITLPGDKTMVFGELQTISYSIHREKHPVRAMGRINAKGYTRGPRTIAGSLIFTVFDRHIVEKLIDRRFELEGHQGNIVTDELPPFDVTITFGNEYGSIARLAIYGITITDEGQVMSIEDMVTEQTMTYVALDIDLLTPQLVPHRGSQSAERLVGTLGTISGGRMGAGSNGQ